MLTKEEVVHQLVMQSGDFTSACLKQCMFGMFIQAWLARTDGLSDYMAEKPFVNIWLASTESGLEYGSEEACCEFGDGPRYFNINSTDEFADIIREIYPTEVCAACGDDIDDYTNIQVCSCCVNCCDSCALHNPNDDSDNERYCVDCVPQYTTF